MHERAISNVPGEGHVESEVAGTGSVTAGQPRSATMA